MYHKMVLKKVLFPVSSTALFTVAAGEEKKDEKEKKELVRRKELSIYPVKKEEKSEVQEKEAKPDSVLMSTVKQVRETVWSMNKQLNEISDGINHVIETGKAHTSSAIQTLREEDNYPQRYGAIGVGGLVGYIIAIRRGWFRRIIYTGTGAAAVAAIVYPEEAKEITSEGFRITKKYIVIAYHFINGVLRDYAGLQLPNLPGPLAIGSASAAEKDSSTVPSSAALMPPPASAPSHISAGPIPLPPLDLPSSVSDGKKQGNNGKKPSSNKPPKKEKGEQSDKELEPQPDSQPDPQPETQPEPKPASFVFPDRRHTVTDQNMDYSMYSRRA